jgi:3-hydroxyisobutyrate dehydrogenase
MNAESPRVAVLGTGIMGSEMSRVLLAAGIPVTAWDRSSDAAAPLGEAGARVAATAPDAVRDAQVVITMVPTSDAVVDVLFDGGVADAFADGAVWAQMGTIGVAATLEIAGRIGQARSDVMFVDAPVSGSKGPAANGQLVILASGPSAAREITEPVFAALGSKTLWLGEAGQGSRMKLVLNAYLAILVEGVAEALELAGRLGFDAAAVDAAIEGGSLDAPLTDAKLHKMETGDYAPEFPLEWALKDVDLSIAAAPGANLPLLSAVSRQWHATVAAGHGREDVSAARLGLPAQKR